MDESVPMIICDIDGVLCIGNSRIEKNLETVQYIQQPLSVINPKKYSNKSGKLPFVCLTNCGGYEENYYMKNVCARIGLEPENYLQTEQLVMNYTPLKSILQTYKEKTIIVTGHQDEEQILKSYGLSKFLSVQEYCALFPYLVPLAKIQPSLTQSTRRIVAERMQVEENDLMEPLQIHGIFVLYDPIDWEQNIQIIIDLLSTPDGKITKEKRYIYQPNHIPVYFTSYDLVFTSEYQLPRIVQGCFIESLKAIYKEVYGQDLRYECYGKPHIANFKTAIERGYAQTNLKISNIYMIGDNPHSDIQGGNNAGLITILVKTGVWKENRNNEHFPAAYVVHNFNEAIMKILELEGIH